ncbi:MAG: penicillin-binding protein 2 [bacterium]
MDKYLNNKKIKTKFRENIEFHEILLDRLAKRREEELGISEKKFETPLVKIIIQSLFFVSILALFLLFLRVFQLQVINGKDYSALAEENKFISRQIQAERGVIYDSEMKQLVFNQPGFDLVYQSDAEEQSGQDSAFGEVARILNVSVEEIKNKIKDGKTSPVLIAENLDHQALIMLETKINELSGFQIENNLVRHYEDGNLYAHLIGYKRKNDEKSGLEKSYDENLKEKSGEILIEKDVKGNIISKKIVALPEPGDSLVLWLDSALQEKITQSLGDALGRVGAKIGAAVAIDPKTGGVLSLVSLPSFDNNLFSKGMSQAQWQAFVSDPVNPLFNRAIAGQYPTGSTIKPLVASAALEEKIISPEKQIYDPGYIEVPHRYDPEIVYRFNDWTVHGWTDMRKAIAESCNVYFYTIGGGFGDQKGLGPSKIKKYLELFGWGSPTGIDLFGEAKGIVPSPEWKKEVLKEDWWDGDTYYYSIGQQYLLVTPAQEAAAFVAIANGGKLFQPQAAKRIINAQKETIKEFEPKLVREGFISPQNLQVVREGMRQAVTSPSGSAHTLNSLPVQAAAKTGTAQIGEGDRYDTWISVFAPYDDPQIVLTVAVENVQNLSRLVVLPIAQEVLQWYFTKQNN